MKPPTAAQIVRFRAEYPPGTQVRLWPEDERVWIVDKVSLLGLLTLRRTEGEWIATQTTRFDMFPELRKVS